jgi:peptidoglycan hydrolase-like protein with peptidoglycan-binding domain
MIDPEVKELQKFLNSKGFIVSLDGVGSVGNETDYFGEKTRSALIKFQQAHAITPAVGYFGPVTRAKISDL